MIMVFPVREVRDSFTFPDVNAFGTLTFHEQHGASWITDGMGDSGKGVTGGLRKIAEEAFTSQMAE